MKIELKPSRDRYNTPNGRQVFIDGEHWADAIAEHHGVHGVSYVLHFPGSGARILRRDDGRSNPLVANKLGGNKRRAKFWGEEFIPALDRIAPLVALAIGDGWLKSPAVRKAEDETEEKRRKARQRAEDEREELIHNAMRSLYARRDLSNAERAGLGEAFKAIFGVTMKESVP